MISKKGWFTAGLGAAGVVAAMGVAGAPGFAPAERRLMFTWDGSDQDAWKDSMSWVAAGGFGYPDDSSDDAVLDNLGGSIDIVLSSGDLVIDDLTLPQQAASTARIVDSGDNAVTLTCDSIVIAGPPSSGVNRLTAYDRVKIETQ